MFSFVFVVDTKIIYCHNFIAPLRSPKEKRNNNAGFKKFVHNSKENENFNILYKKCKYDKDYLFGLFKMLPVIAISFWCFLEPGF